jgi:hypothetical protein
MMRSTTSTFLAVAVLFVSCAARPLDPSVAGAESQRSRAKAPPAAIELPREFGIYVESARGLEPLMATPTLAAKNPSFVVYLQELPPIERLRLRFGKGGTNLFVIEYGEGAGVFEAKMEPVPGRNELYRAVYFGTLEPGTYMAYTFVDASEAPERWKKARFEFAGQFKVE